MTAALVLIPGLCYLLASILYARHGNWPFVIVYSGYFWANCGLLWLDRLQVK